MLSKIINSVTYAILFVLVVACSLLYFNTLSLKKDIVEKDAKITQISNDNKLLSAEKKRLLASQKINDEVTLEKNKIAKELSGHLDNALNELKSTPKTEKRGNENAGKKSLDTPLDHDIIRVLDDLCYKVRGTKCPNP